MKDLSVILDELEALANAATPGPWRETTKCWNDGGVPLADRFVSSDAQIVNPVLLKLAWNGDKSDYLTRRAIADQKFIASTRTSNPRLIKALRYLWERYKDEEQASLVKLVEHRITAILNGEEKNTDLGE